MRSQAAQKSIRCLEGSSETFKIQLTDFQVSFLNQLLPVHHSLKNFQILDEKRVRAPKKADEIYETNFSKKTIKSLEKYSPRKINRQEQKGKNTQKGKPRLTKERKPKNEVKEEKQEKIIIEEQPIIEIPVEEPQIKQFEEVEERQQMNLVPFKKKDFCLNFIKKLKAHKSAWPFRHPVDPINQGVPNYPDIVKEPMDLKTIQKKVNLNKYQHISEFHGDINKIFLNSYKFNPRQTQYYALTIELQAYYNQLMKETDKNPNVAELVLKVKKGKTEQQFYNENDPKKKKLMMNKKKIISLQQKKQLVKRIRNLSSADLSQVVETIYKYEGKQLNDNDTEINIYIEKLGDEILQNLELLVNKLQEQKKSRVNVSETKLSLF